MNKKITKRHPQALKQEHLEIILEDMESKFKVVTEAINGLSDKIDTKFDNLSAKVDANRDEMITLIFCLHDVRRLLQGVP